MHVCVRECEVYFLHVAHLNTTTALELSLTKLSSAATKPVYSLSVCKLVQSLEEKDPFAQYSIVAKNNPPPRGLKIEYGSPTDPSTYPSGTFDVIVDNNGKSMDECQPLIDTYAKDVRIFTSYSFCVARCLLSASSSLSSVNPGLQSVIDVAKRLLNALALTMRLVVTSDTYQRSG